MEFREKQWIIIMKMERLLHKARLKETQPSAVGKNPSFFEDTFSEPYI